MILFIFVGFWYNSYTLLDNQLGKTHIPLSNGLEVRVILGGIMSGTCRALIGQSASIFIKCNYLK